MNAILVLICNITGDKNKEALVDGGTRVSPTFYVATSLKRRLLLEQCGGRSLDYVLGALALDTS